MLKDRILELFQEYDPEVRRVIAQVLDEEWANLSYQRPRQMNEKIKKIIEEQVANDED